MNNFLRKNLVCPVDKLNLNFQAYSVKCSKGHIYPLIDDVPVMIRNDIIPTDQRLHKLQDLLKSKRLNHSKIESLYNLQKTVKSEHIDLFVQKEVAATCGIFYKYLIGNLTRYPIPDLRLPKVRNKYLLDIGCNWGRWSIAASKKGYFVVGLDPSLEAIMAAKRVTKQLKVKNVIFVVSDARSLPFRDDCFNNVFSYSVIQHFSRADVQKTLSEISRVLKIKGSSFIQMPNKFGPVNLLFQLLRGFKESTDSRCFDVRYWTPKELMNNFETAIGKSKLTIDGFFTLNSQPADVDLFPKPYKILIDLSEYLRKLGGKYSWITNTAESLYIKSVKK